MRLALTDLGLQLRSAYLTYQANGGDLDYHSWSELSVAANRLKCRHADDILLSILHAKPTHSQACTDERKQVA